MLRQQRETIHVIKIRLGYTYKKNIDWMTYSSCYTSFSTNKNRNIARCIHHRLLFSKMTFVFKYIYPACGLILDSVASRDHFWLVSTQVNRNQNVSLHSSRDWINFTPIESNYHVLYYPLYIVLLISSQISSSKTLTPIIISSSNLIPVDITMVATNLPPLSYLPRSFYPPLLFPLPPPHSPPLLLL